MSARTDARSLARAERVAELMDSRLRLPFTRITLGLDFLLGLVPVLGDTLALAPSLYILFQARLAGAPRHLIARMAGNLGIDWAIGLLPLIGDVFDIGYKANLRNAALLRAFLEARGQPAGTGPATMPRAGARIPARPA